MASFSSPAVETMPYDPKVVGSHPTGLFFDFSISAVYPWQGAIRMLSCSAVCEIKVDGPRIA